MAKLELSDFVGQPCKSRVAYEFIPKKKMNLNLEELSKKLENQDVYIEISTPFLLILKLNGQNISLFSSGKMIIKELKEPKKAREIAEKLVEKISIK
ncbi:MAG TPA: hypothetical protein VJK05_03575 [archaeon]|nr:hypothetical protein [archaeon]